MTDLVIAIIVIFGLLLFIISMNLKVVPENKALVIERFGVFHRIIDQPGIYFLIPILERVCQTVPLNEERRLFSFKYKNEEIQFSYVYKVVDIKIFVYGTLDTLGVINKEIEMLYQQDPIMYQESFDSIIELGKNLGVELRGITKHN